LHGTPHLGSGASFVSVTQQFNTTTSMARLTLNILLSFARFEREVIGERIRDKIATSKKKVVTRVRLGDVRFVYHQSRERDGRGPLSTRAHALSGTNCPRD
jgi:DNA invertase Pin-like site-specific DNA recombinase